MGGDLSMGSFSVVLLHHAIRILAVVSSNDTSSQAPNSNNSNNPNYATNVTAKFNPSMAIIIIVLISAFLFMGFFSIYVRRCTHSENRATQQAAQQALRNNANRSGEGQGLDRSVVEALPLVGYSLVKGLKGGKDLNECAVCLSDFEEDENLRLLPKCGHVFHPDCIDMWFFSHTTCPLCRSSLVAGTEGKMGEPSVFSEEFQNWVSSRGTGPDGQTFTIHDGPPVPPNGSILELLSRDGADSILAESLRRTESLDPGLARREGEEEVPERAQGIRAMNRALSKNSSSFRKATRSMEAIDRIGSARFNSDSVSITIDSSNGEPIYDNKPRRESKSIGSTASFNAALRRSSSVGSSGRYIRQLLGLNYPDFSPTSEQDGLRIDRARLLGSEHKINPPPRRERSVTDVRTFELPMWEDVDLNDSGEYMGGNVQSTAAAPASQGPGRLSLERWASRGRKFFSAELGRTSQPAKAAEPSVDARKDTAVEERAKSDRWNFGQSFRRTFSLRRTAPVDVESSSSQQQSSTGNGNNNKPLYNTMLPGPSASKPKKFSTWAGAMKMRRQISGEGLPSPHSPSAPYNEFFPQSFPVESPRSLSVSDDRQQEQKRQEKEQQEQDSILVVTQP